MIYEYPSTDIQIRQGDIFAGLPRVELSLDRLPILDDNNDNYIETKWSEIAAKGTTANALLAIRPVTAIVITQDCDAVRAPDITLCEIRPFREVEGKAKETKNAKAWTSIITQQSRLNLKWFYLPPDSQIGFSDKQAVDFRITIRVPGADLENLRNLRKGRLIPEADEHFRERLSEFFRRYPYDEWYPLNHEEFEVYKQNYKDAQPRPWQTATPPMTERR